MCNDKCGRNVETGEGCTERDLLATTDARVWAQEFKRRYDGYIVHESTLAGWFANAIEAGRSAGYAGAVADAAAQAVEDGPTNDPDYGDLAGIHIYRAFASPGTPACVSTDTDDDDLAVIIYDDEFGAIRGVKVTQGPTLLAATGEFPVAAINEEREYLGLDLLEVEPWLIATAIGA